MLFGLLEWPFGAFRGFDEACDLGELALDSKERDLLEDINDMIVMVPCSLAAAVICHPTCVIPFVVTHRHVVSVWQMVDFQFQ